MGVLKMKKIILTTILIFVATVSLSFALPISGSGALGSFSGDFNYNSLNSQITVSLTNTSPAANGGFLTAFAFNIPVSFQITGFTALNYRFVGPTTPVTTLSFGSFDTGAAFFDTSWGSGGTEGGIKVNEPPGEFTFTLLGNGLSGLEVDDFFSQTYPWFVARYALNGISEEIPFNPSKPVPEPATMLLLCAGLIGMGFFSRKRFLK
jgi:hypothetical protein